MSDEVKKDVTQEQLEGILAKQFKKAQDWEFFIAVGFFMLPWFLLGLAGITLPLPFHIVFAIVILFAFWSSEKWVVARRVRKTIEAMKAV
jgi:hypothetical protein